MEHHRSFETVDTHTAGEPTRIVTGGIEWPDTADSISAYREHFKTEYDWVRELLLKEPRGHAGMFGAIPVFEVETPAAFGVFFMDQTGYLDMCGHGTIGVVTALIETGRIDSDDEVLIETPAGIVRTDPVVSDGRVESVTVENVPAFVVEHVEVAVEPFGSVDVDVVSAGNLFALVAAESIGLDVADPEAAAFVDAGIAIRDAVNRAGVIEGSRAVELTELYWTVDGIDRNITVFGDGMVDRSPCGTGTCAKMALLYDAGSLAVGERYRNESVIGTRFNGEIRGVDERDGRAMIRPAITGSAYVTGEHRFVLDRDDPLGGFTLP